MRIKNHHRITLFQSLLLVHFDMDKERREREKKMYESKGWHRESHDRLRGDLRATKRHIKELNKELHPIVASWGPPSCTSIHVKVIVAVYVATDPS